MTAKFFVKNHADTDERLVFGWASVATAPTGRRSQITRVTSSRSELETAAYDFVQFFRLRDARKGGLDIAVIIEASLTPEKIAALGLKDGDCHTDGG